MFYLKHVEASIADIKQSSRTHLVVDFPLNGYLRKRSLPRRSSLPGLPPVARIQFLLIGVKSVGHRCFGLGNANPNMVPHRGQDVRKSSAGVECVATIAGTTAIRFATTTTPVTMRTMTELGTTDTGTAPRLFANAIQTARPVTTPKGTPATIPIKATVVACQDTVAPTWRFTKPSTFRRPISRRRRLTLTASKCASVAAPNKARIAPKMSGKLTASPKLIKEIGVIAKAALPP